METFEKQLNRLQEFITEMEGTSSNKVKLGIIKKYSNDTFIVKVLNTLTTGTKNTVCM